MHQKGGDYAADAASAPSSSGSTRTGVDSDAEIKAAVFRLVDEVKQAFPIDGVVDGDPRRQHDLGETDIAERLAMGRESIHADPLGATATARHYIRDLV
jgi:hypothetical protein